MIISFRGQLAADLFFNRFTGVSRRFPHMLLERAKRRLQYLHSARALNDLASPPGNKLEALRGDRKGYYSIRINNQWRIVFKWENGAKEVEIVDYH